MRTLLVALAAGLAIAECMALEQYVFHALPNWTANLVTALNAGVVARALSEPVLGRTWAVSALLVIACVYLLLPPGHGLSGALLMPLALSLLKNSWDKEKHYD